MLRLAGKRAVAAAASSCSSLRSHTSLCNSFSPITNRPHCTNAPPNTNPVAVQMINYAFSHARSQKSDGSYAEALLVLEQGISNFQGVDKSSEDAIGMVLLAMATLLAERGDYVDAIDKLQLVQELNVASISLRVAAMEALVGLHLQMEKDIAASEIADNCLQFFKDNHEDDDATCRKLHLRAKAMKGLVDLVNGNLESAKSSYEGCHYSVDDGSCFGQVALSYGEFLHSSGDFSLAKDLYQKAIKVSQEKNAPDSSSVAAAGMVSEEVILGATCALGQLHTHSGNFQEAEEVLTQALKKAEEHFGLNHPKVGAVLTCMALLYGHNARLHGASSLLIQEGLYRRALDLLKAPTLDTDGADIQTNRSDVMVLTRGGYAQALQVQQNRKDEGERMKKWAENTWRNRRLSLYQALEITEPSKVPVIDTRIERVL
ncbi:uncharacterized protein LOC18436213 isoform X2 [Amborella trichopoda]|uniref:uncharacterized protein LOC18436213 isoform X2 n=1 Tax=Amborella trichopoda TaxID=13333 RepID=UPI0009C0295E|nr:uncharacterized protein LOC18436213 isoform X2 [Amborella trichopoda]|eukprot:XP_020523951.1 uncharacterized protein LOC18436213 isoform X2 [Amborella trichopoda]